MKQSVQIIIWMLAIILPTMVNAYDFEVDGIYYGLNTTDMTAYVTYNNSDQYTGIITIPETVTYNTKELTVAAIGNSAFYGCSNLTNVSLPSSIKVIEEKAFMISGIVGIEIPEGVKEIPEKAFCNCASLKKVVLPNSITTIGESAFSSSTIEEINFPEGLIRIDTWAFLWCDSLKEIILPNSLTALGQCAFSGCASVKKIIIGSGVTQLGNSVFSDCRSVSSLRIPSNITNMYNNCMNGCTGMDSLIFDNDESAIFFTHSSSPNAGASAKYVYLGRNINAPYISNSYYPFSLNSVNEVSFGSNYSDEDNLITMTPNIERISSHNCSPSPINEFPTWVYANLPLFVPLGTKFIYENTNGWNKFFNIIEDPSLGTGAGGEEIICEAPTIHYSNKKLFIESNTVGAKCHTTISCADVKESTSNEISLDAIYDISTYADADGYVKSETVTAKLYWVSATLNPQMINFIKSDVNSDGEVNIADINYVINQILNGSTGHQLSSESDVRGILIQKVGNSLIISGLYDDEEIALCDEFGKKLYSTKAASGVARFNVNTENNTIKIGDKIIKVLM